MIITQDGRHLDARSRLGFEVDRRMASSRLYKYPSRYHISPLRDFCKSRRLRSLEREDVLARTKSKQSSRSGPWTHALVRLAQPQVQRIVQSHRPSRIRFCYTSCIAYQFRHPSPLTVIERAVCSVHSRTPNCYTVLYPTTGSTTSSNSPSVQQFNGGNHPEIPPMPAAYAPTCGLCRTLADQLIG
jgi:hypothetical protein